MKRSTPQPPDRPSLTPEQLQILEADKVQMGHVMHQAESQLVQDWHGGVFLNQVEDRDLWRNDPLCKANRFVDYVCLATRFKSRNPVERRMHLARRFPDLKEVERMARRGLCLTKLSIVISSPPELEPALMALALQEDKISCEVLAHAKKQALRALRAQHKSSRQGEALVHAALLEAVAQGTREEAQQAPAPLCPGCQQGRREHGEREEAPGAGELWERGQELQARQRELEEREQALAAREQAGQAELAERERQLMEQQAQLLRQPGTLCLATVLALYEQVRQQAGQAQLLCEQALAQRAAAEAESEARLGQAQARLQALHEQSALLEQEQAEVRAALDRERTTLAEDRAAFLAEQAEHQDSCRALEARHNELDARQEELTRQAQSLEQQRAALAEQDRLFKKKVFEHEKSVAENPMYTFRFPAQPYCMDSTLLCIQETLDHVIRMAEHATDVYLPEGDLPEQGGIGAILAVKQAQKDMNKVVTDFLMRVNAAYVEEFEDEAIRFYRENPELFGKKAAAPQGAAIAEPSSSGPSASSPPPPSQEAPKTVYLNTSAGSTPQWGILGKLAEEMSFRPEDIGKKPWTVAVDLNQVGCITIAGLTDTGKSSTVLTLAEMMRKSKSSISEIKVPLGVLYCNYEGRQPYPHGLHRCHQPNSEPKSVAYLRDVLGATPEGIPDVKYLIVAQDEDDLKRKIAELPSGSAEGLEMSLEDAGIDGLRMLMAADDNASLYLAEWDEAVREIPRGQLTMEKLESLVEDPRFNDRQRGFLRIRLRAVKRYCSGKESVTKKFGPGVLMAVLFKDQWVKETEAMAVFAILTRAISQARDKDGNEYTKAIIYDEAHKYITKSAILAPVTSLICQMRHMRTWIVLATQDPKHLPREIHKLATMSIVHRIRSKESLKYLQECNEGWHHVTVEDLAALKVGEAYILVHAASDESFVIRPRKVRIRPSCAMPGGTTRTAVPTEAAS